MGWSCCASPSLTRSCPQTTRPIAGSIADLAARIRGGTRVAIACRGGLDRTGMTAGCLLREAGLPADEAVDRVHAARDHTLSLPHQLRYVRSWPARRLRPPVPGA